MNLEQLANLVSASLTLHGQKKGDVELTQLYAGDHYITLETKSTEVGIVKLTLSDQEDK